MGNPRLKTAFLLGDDFDAAAFVAPFRKAGWGVRRGRTAAASCRVLDTSDRRLLGAGIAVIERAGAAQRSREYWLVPSDQAPARLMASQSAKKGVSLALPEAIALQKCELQSRAEFSAQATTFDFTSTAGRFAARLVTYKSGPRRSLGVLEIEVQKGGSDVLLRVSGLARHERGVVEERSSFVAEILDLVRLKVGPRIAAHPMLEKGTPAEGAALAVLRCGFENMLAHEAGARMGFDPEYVHDMRVAIRRMRASLRMFSKLFVKQDRATISSELRWLAGALGRVRDLDVYMAAVPRYLALIGADATDYGFYMGELAARRSTARAELIAALDGARYERFKADIRKFFDKPRFSGQGPTLSEIAASSMERFSAEVFEADGEIENESTLHAMRICFKRLRYAVEFLCGLSPKRLRRVARIASRFQDILGRFNDATVACAQVKKDIGQERRDDTEVFLLGYLYACQRLAAINAKLEFLARWRAKGAKRLRQAIRSAHEKL